MWLINLLFKWTSTGSPVLGLLDRSPSLVWSDSVVATQNAWLVQDLGVDLAVDNGQVIDNDELYVKTLFGVKTLVARPLTHDERSALRTLRTDVNGPLKLLSSVQRSQALPELLALSRRPNTTTRDLAACVVHDPLLLAECLRIANTAFSTQVRRIKCIEKALDLMGVAVAREVCVRALLRPVFLGQAGCQSDIAAPIVWRQSEHCADAMMLRRPPGMNEFEAYMAGLFANTGAVVLMRMLDVWKFSSQTALSRQFFDEFQILSAYLSVRIATHWGLPENVLATLRERHAYLAKGAAGDANLLHRVDQFARTQVCVWPI